MSSLIKERKKLTAEPPLLILLQQMLTELHWEVSATQTVPPLRLPLLSLPVVSAGAQQKGDPEEHVFYRDAHGQMSILEDV